MEYKKKLLTMPTTLAERLSKESNQSAVVVDALERFYAGKDGSKALAQLTKENTEAIAELADYVERTHRMMRQMAIFMKSQGADINLV